MLGHAYGTAIGDLYGRYADRVEKVRVMVQAWGNWCDRTEPTAEIVSLPRRRKAKEA
jgi:hypothetical protein